MKLYNKYHVEKNNGKTDPEAQYFVLRLDTDPKAREALRTYIDQLVEDEEFEFAFELDQLLDNIEWDRQISFGEKVKLFLEVINQGTWWGVNVVTRDDVIKISARSDTFHHTLYLRGDIGNFEADRIGTLIQSKYRMSEMFRRSS